MKVPEMVNKTLRVYCPNCGRSFEVYFKKKKFKFSDILEFFSKIKDQFLKCIRSFFSIFSKKDK